ncbi:Hypothetical protein A7982_00021 [Minicystis rosea]|nr:Hypothetical protein A7982_00021 [Minicystis rosea]
MYVLDPELMNAVEPRAELVDVAGRRSTTPRVARSISFGIP